ncbi:hypothetical protein IV203_037831 [Nitzschia inconspicua]|uniref:LNR domain-containing protein n=1 Tax=Nitzschia inconspicua TaxID=303405 RepID=A0A9K3LMQ6_9STRA|nr:hypothetical protein IV203_037831 [Nitzschia inconspicua]
MIGLRGTLSAATTAILVTMTTSGGMVGAVSILQEKAVVTQSFLSNIDSVHERRSHFHRVLSTIRSVDEWTSTQGNDHDFDNWNAPRFLHAGSSSTGSHRNLEDVEQAACDSSFVQCIPNSVCVECFATLETEDIDWTGVSPGTECKGVVSFLTRDGHCKGLEGNTVATDLFCKTFDSCVIWNENDDDTFEPEEGWVNCTALTKCDWDGIHRNWIGDGVCHDNMHGCYNTAICGYDGGDCCQDTCEITETATYMECGHDGYACKDPKSANCNSALTTRCPTNGSKGGNDPSNTKCDLDKAKYRLVMYDSFGDGWDTTTLTIQPEDGGEVVFKGGLVDGFQGTEYICLSKTSQCYNVKTEGGVWGVEVSWEIRPMGEGSPAIAGGGSPSDCDFSVAGDVCTKTCDGSKPNVDPESDPDYQSFKDLYTCIEEKCVIQLGACKDDPSCKDCFTEDAPDYCYGVDTFVAVIDCTMCSCTDKSSSEYCSEKSGPGRFVPPTPIDPDESKPKACTPKETMAGASAIMDFSKCSDLDEVGILISDFDQNNFGQLDAFETCAHSFRDDANHGGHTAMGCMNILKSAITNPIVDSNSDAPKEAISALAKNLYEHGESFCDCARKSSDACPLCPSFMSFKTILYESIDACQSLDDIDCDSWNEFWKPCKDNMMTEFSSSDFSSKDQCDYVKKDCGGAGTFPAFRRLDCDGEIPDEAWTFYKQYSKSCLKGADGIPPGGNPTPKPYIPSPTSAPDVKPTSDNRPTPKPYVPSNDKPTPKPYVPSDDGPAPYVPSDAQSSKTKKKSHWFRNLVIIAILGGAGYYVYKRRSDGFNFVQYRRRVFGNRFGGGFEYGMVNTGPAESEMFSNLNSSTMFEPPSLPPTPQMMMGGTEMT